MLTDVILLWDELRAESSSVGKHMERLVRPDSEVEIVLGAGGDQCALSVSAVFPADWNKTVRLPNCLTCSLMQDRSFQTARFQLRDDVFEDIFIWFSQDVVNRLESCSVESAVQVLQDALAEWEEAFMIQPDRGMSRQAQQGLFAEIFFLKEILLCEHPEEGLLGWHSQNSVHDFQIGEAAWEVKSFGGRRMEVRISSEDQLDYVGLETLVLAVVGLKVSEEAGASVTDIVGQLVRKVGNNREQLMHLKTGLAKYGYIDESSVIQKYLFTPRSVFEYAVTDGFPRITSRNIPSAVHDVKYTLSLGSLETHLIKPVIEY